MTRTPTRALKGTVKAWALMRGNTFTVTERPGGYVFNIFRNRKRAEAIVALSGDRKLNIRPVEIRVTTPPKRRRK